jgi:hypothetical protein
MHLKLTLLSCLLFLTTFVSGSDYYWVGGDGDWSDINHWATSSGGNVKHIQTPTAADNVYFDGNSANGSFEVNMTHPVSFSKSLDFSGLTDSLLLYGVCNEIKIYGSLSLNEKAIWSLSNLTFSFESQQNGNTITSANTLFPGHISLEGLNGSWSLNDSLYSTYNIYHNAGTFYTNNKTVRIGQYHSTSTTSRFLELGSSDLYVQGVNVANSGFACTPGTSHIHLYGGNFQVLNNTGVISFYDLTVYSNSSINTGTVEFHNVVLRMDAQVNGTNSYNILHLTKNCTYNISGNHEIITDLEADGGCNQMIVITGPHVFTKSSGTVDVSYIKLKHSTATGGASWNAYDSYDLGSNSGWIIHPFTPRTLYWVGGTGSWDDSTHWALSSGGPGGECYPEIIDNVVFDNNSFGLNDSVYIDQLEPAKCHDMTWVNTVPGKISGNLNQTLLISGSLDFSPHTILAYYGDTRFISDDQGEHIKTANHWFPYRVVFDGKGSWEQRDSLNITKEYELEEGTFYTLGHPISCSNFFLTSFHSKTIYLSTSHIYVEAYVDINQDSCFIHRGTSTFHIKNDKLGLRAYSLPRQKLWNVIMENTDSSQYPEVVLTQLEIHKLTFKGNGLKKGKLKVDSLIFATGNDFVWRGIDTITQHLRCSGYCTQTTTWRAVEPTETFAIIKTSGTLQIDRTNLRGSHTSGGATFIAVNSSDVGMNSGWIFQNTSEELYWIGDSGDWHDSLHWSYNSGGTGGACIPTIVDTVYFDNNSFSQSQQVVLISRHTAFCRDMHWSNGLSYPAFNSLPKTILYVAGNMEMGDQMSVNNLGNIFFCDTTPSKYILSNGQNFNWYVAFIDHGEWSFSDDFEIETGIELIKGSLNTNGNKVTIGLSFGGSSPYTKQFNMSNSKVIFKDVGGQALFYWNHYNSACQFTSTNSHVHFYHNANVIHLMGNGQVDFHNVYFEEDVGHSYFKADPGINNFNNYVIFRNSGTIFGDHFYDTLIFTAGNSYTLRASTTQTIGSLFQADGYCTQTINITGAPGSSAIFKNTGLVEINKVNLSGVMAQGNATFNSFGGQDLGYNPNWNFFPDLGRTLYWVNGSGNWNDTVHWSLSSGGIGGECIPTKIDEVIVDKNSYSTKQFSIFAPPGAECFNLGWFDKKYGEITGNVQVFGGLNIRSNIDLSAVEFLFKTEKMGNILKTGSNRIGKARFLGSGEWKLKDTLWVADTLTYLGGFLDTEGNTILAHTLYSGQSYHKKGLKLRNSDIRLNYMWKMNSDSLSLSGCWNIHHLFREWGYEL